MQILQKIHPDTFAPLLVIADDEGKSLIELNIELACQNQLDRNLTDKQAFDECMAPFIESQPEAVEFFRKLTFD